MTPTAVDTPTPRVSPPHTAAPTARPTPSPAPSPTPSASAHDEPIQPGRTAYVDVAVATGWRTPAAVRQVDVPALEDPARIRDWLTAMSDADIAGLIGSADSQMLLGESVEVLAIEGGWAQVVVPDQATPLDPRGYPLWIPTAQLTSTPPITSIEEATVVVPTTWLESEDGTADLEVSFGTRLPVLGTNATAVRVALPDGSTMSAESQAVVVARSGESLAGTGAAVVDSARAFIGLPYLWAGTSGFGYDCSGLVYSVYKAHGVLLPRDGAPQSTVGVPVEWQDIEPGDLVFFARDGSVHHVAIYVGNGEVLESPYIGAAVRVMKLSALPYAAEYAGARRVLER
jgi:cell wall-associated NlpC family hydrolase